MHRDIMTLSNLSNKVTFTTIDHRGFTSITEVRRTNINKLRMGDPVNACFTAGTNSGDCYNVNEINIDGVTYRDEKLVEIFPTVADIVMSSSGRTGRHNPFSVNICPLRDNKLPARGSEGAAAYDCFGEVLSADDFKDENVIYLADRNVLRLLPGKTFSVKLGFALALPTSRAVAKLMPRSGLGRKGLVLGNLTGIIDSDYRGELEAVLWNRTDDTIDVDLNKAVCQMTFETVLSPVLNVITPDELEKLSTDRGTGGFGSSDGSGK